VWIDNYKESTDKTMAGITSDRAAQASIRPDGSCTCAGLPLTSRRHGARKPAPISSAPAPLAPISPAQAPPRISPAEVLWQAASPGDRVGAVMSTNGKERRESPVHVHRLGMQVAIGWGCSFRIRHRQRRRSKGGSPSRRAAVDGESEGPNGGSNPSILDNRPRRGIQGRVDRPPSLRDAPNPPQFFPLKTPPPGNHQLGPRARLRPHRPVHAALAPPVPARSTLPRLLSVVSPGTRTSAGRR
jgi:hypothetical protein